MTVVVSELSVESGVAPGAVAVARPRVSWKVTSRAPGWTQGQAELELDGESVLLDGDESVLRVWPFAPIEPHSRHRLRVRVTGADGTTTPWSAALEVRSQFLADGDWQAELIGLDDPQRDAQPFRVRREFEVGDSLIAATLFATALGGYQARINGVAVDNQVLKPGWTPFRTRLIHETTDVTHLLRPGANAIGADVAGAWFTQGYFLPHPRYGAQAAVALQLRLEYSDGRVDIVATDDRWRALADGPLVSSGIYNGEDWDARRETDGWDEPNFDGDWQPVRYTDWPVQPTARTTPAVRITDELPVVDVLRSPSDTQILDFGQNLVGRLRLRLRGRAGTTVTVRHAEVLEAGELGVRPLRSARAAETYVLRGDPHGELLEPLFTFHGFRYAEVTGLDDMLDPEDATAIVLHSDMRRTGWFESSHPLLNRLHENVVWGMRGNFLYLPTDCPQRNERMGWTGDIQVFAPTASFLYDTNAFLSSWLVDLGLEQSKLGGLVPIMVPIAAGDAKRGVAAWGDAATVVPSVLHDRYADLGVLRAQYSSMRDWTDYVLTLVDADGLWSEGFQYGDWLDPAAPPEDPYQAMTDSAIVATAYLIRSADLTARAADLLGQDADSERFRSVAEHTRSAFVRAYVLPSDRMSSDSQTAYALALVFDIVRTADVRTRLAARLAELVEANGHHIGTGFVGTPLIADALSENGHLDTAANLLLETTSPSWLYPVTMGATTVWERWDSMLEDGTINPGEMTSFNHYALGAVADWMHRTVAGLAPASPGYRSVRVSPRPLDGLDYARARHESPYGTIEAGWRRTLEGEIIVDAIIPPNSWGEVTLPGAHVAIRVGSGTHKWTVPNPSGATSQPV